MDTVLEFTEAEETLIKHYAEEKGMTVEDFLRQTVLSRIAEGQ